MVKKVTVAFFGETNHPSHNVKWINYLVAKDLINAVVFVRPNQNTSKLDSHVKVFKTMRPFPFFFPLRLLRHVKRLKDILRKEEVDVLHFLWGIDDCCLGLFLGKPYLITTRGSDVLRDLRKHYLEPQLSFTKRALADLGKRWYHLVAYKKAIAITSTSFAQQKLVLQFQPKIKQVAIVRTGVELTKFSDLRRPTKPEKKIIFSPRTMREIYNQDIIIEAFKLFLKKVPNAQLRIIDNLPNSEWSKKNRRFVQTLNLNEEVIFLPSLNIDEMIIEYLKADVCVMIPKSDGTPVSGIESMLCQTPLIIGDYDYDEDLFNESTVWQCKSNTPEALAQKIHGIVEESEAFVSSKIQNARLNALSKVDIKGETQKLLVFYHQKIEK